MRMLPWHDTIADREEEANVTSADSPGAGGGHEGRSFRRRSRVRIVSDVRGGWLRDCLFPATDSRPEAACTG